MMKYVPLIGVVFAVLVLIGGIRSEATAGAQVAASVVKGNLAVPSSGLLVKIKHKKQHNKNNKNHNDDNDDQSSSDNQDNAGLSDCTIIQPGGGGGCTVGRKWVCETMKSGAKCCGCVVDKNAPPPKKVDAKPQLLLFACTSNVRVPDGREFADRKSKIGAANDTEARMIYMSRLGPGVVLLGAVTCIESSSN